MRFTTVDGKEWEFRGEYRRPTPEDNFLQAGNTLEGVKKLHLPPLDVRAIVYEVVPPPIRHVFGGVVFEETGIRWRVKKGEWFLFDMHNGYMEVRCYNMPTKSVYEHQILRVVGMADEV